MQRHGGVHDAVAGLLDARAEALEMPSKDGAVDALEVTPVGWLFWGAKGCWGGDTSNIYVCTSRAHIHKRQKSNRDIQRYTYIQKGTAYLLGMVQAKVAKCRCARSQTSKEPGVRVLFYLVLVCVYG